MPLPLSNAEKVLMGMGKHPMTINQVANHANLTWAATYSALRRLIRIGKVTEFDNKTEGRPSTRFYTKVDDQKIAS